jgi:hypothetical protein
MTVVPILARVERSALLHARPGAKILVSATY